MNGYTLHFDQHLRIRSIIDHKSKTLTRSLASLLSWLN